MWRTVFAFQEKTNRASVQIMPIYTALPLFDRWKHCTWNDVAPYSVLTNNRHMTGVDKASQVPIPKDPLGWSDVKDDSVKYLRAYE